LADTDNSTATAFMLTPNASATCCAWAFAIHAMPSFAHANNARSNSLSIDTSPTSRAFTKAANRVPTGALTHDTCAPSKALSVDAESAFTKSNNTVPAFPISTDANRIT
jgi:hypothetical protein